MESRSATRWVALCNSDHDERQSGDSLASPSLEGGVGGGGGKSEVRVEWWSKTLVDSLLRSEAPVVLGMIEEAPSHIR